MFRVRSRGSGRGVPNVNKTLLWQIETVRRDALADNHNFTEYSDQVVCLLQRGSYMLSGGSVSGKGSHHVIVLVVEDEDVSRRALVNLLAMSGYPARAVPSAEDALALAEEQLPDVAVVDLDLPGMNGAKLIENLLQTKPEMKTVLLTAADPERVALMSGGKKLDQLRKPIDFNDLLRFLGNNEDTTKVWQ